MLLLVGSLGLWARQSGYGYRPSRGHDNYNFFYGTVAGGYTSLMENVEAAHVSGGFGGLMGVGYEFRNNGFWLSIGAQLQLRENTVQVSDLSYTYFHDEHPGSQDAMGVPADFHYLINQRDEQNSVLLGVPLMLGYYKNGFYFGLGGKLDYNLSTTVNTSGKFDLTATYDRYEGIWQDMPAYGYGEYPISHRSEVELPLHGSIIGEIGYDILATLRTRSRTCQVLKVGFYFEVGVSPLYEIPYEQTHCVWGNPGQDAAYDIHINAFMPNGLQVGDNVRPYFTGLKITYMIGGSRTGGSGTLHRGCQCYDH